jgi:hypothetical protein
MLKAHNYLVDYHYFNTDYPLDWRAACSLSKVYKWRALPVIGRSLYSKPWWYPKTLKGVHAFLGFYSFYGIHELLLGHIFCLFILSFMKLSLSRFSSDPYPPSITAELHLHVPSACALNESSSDIPWKGAG